MVIGKKIHSLHTNLLYIDLFDTCHSGLSLEIKSEGRVEIVGGWALCGPLINWQEKQLLEPSMQ